MADQQANPVRQDASPRPAMTALDPVDSVTITTLADNLFDALLRDEGPAKRPQPGKTGPRVRAAFMEGGEVGDSLRAEHGYSALMSFSKGGRQHTLLFDTGVSPTGMVENMRRLELTAKNIEALVLSHGHFDHTTGLDGLAGELGSSNLPVTIHPDFWNRRRMVIPGRDPFEVPTTSKSAMRGAGFEIIEDRQPSFLFDRSLLVSGEVDRTSGFEVGMPMQQAFRNGEWLPDPLTLDDQAVVLNVRDKGLVVLTGCGHAGIVNIVRYARKLTGVQQVYAVMGGFHLNGPAWEPTIPATVAELASLAPRVIVPAHCTGWRAQRAISTALPDAFIQNSVGTRFEL